MIAVLYVEDDEQHVRLLRDAWRRAGLQNSLHVMKDGQAAMEYLAGTGPYTDRAAHPVPGLVLLDLNVPKVAGRDLLKWIRGRDATRTLRVVVFSASNSPAEIKQARHLGANAYWVKPPDATHLDEMIASLKRLWLDEPASTVAPGTMAPGHVKLTTRMTVELPGELADRLSDRAFRERKNMEALLIELLGSELS